ncbi:MAG: dienelactone hydrolase family protein [Beijerinckiaceae bacterium]|jgi:dienelactone hydrolase|nr:dienelactone hydrolase family protein [Beijerinckiaceae bacterium]
MNRRHVIALGLGALAAPVTPLLAQPRPSSNAGEPVTIERFEARGGGRRPAVLLLHGSDGLTRRERYDTPGRALAAAGYTVFLPHYFERTGDRRAAFRDLRTKFPVWLQAIDESVDFVARQPGVDPGRIAVVGASLGGALALALSAQEPRIRAVVNFFGYVPEQMRQARRIAPTLTLHGEEDRLVPVSNAYEIDRLLRERGTASEQQIYPGEGHGLSGAAFADAVMRTANFLDRQIGRR